jgi:hypothetical protein
MAETIMRLHSGHKIQIILGIIAIVHTIGFVIYLVLT